MTTLYRPVLIESAEQAEKLPQSTILLSGHLDEPWDLTTFFCDPDEGCPATMLDALTAGVRMTALVPIEAEEERQAIAECEIGVPGTERIVHEHRFVTPWEER